jgi:hypothetical protein
VFNNAGIPAKRKAIMLAIMQSKTRKQAVHKWAFQRPKAGTNSSPRILQEI